MVGAGTWDGSLSQQPAGWPGAGSQQEPTRILPAPPRLHHAPDFACGNRELGQVTHDHTRTEGIRHEERDPCVLPRAQPGLTEPLGPVGLIHCRTQLCCCCGRTWPGLAELGRACRSSGGISLPVTAPNPAPPRLVSGTRGHSPSQGSDQHRREVKLLQAPADARRSPVCWCGGDSGAPSVELRHPGGPKPTPIQPLGRGSAPDPSRQSRGGVRPAGGVRIFPVTCLAEERLSIK